MKLSLLGLFVFALGCSRFEHVSECKALVATVNEGIAKAEIISKEPDKPEKFKELAAEYKELASRVQALPVAQGKAKTEVKEYVELLRSTSDALKTAEGVVQTGGRPDAYTRELERLTRRERLSIGKLETYCQSF